MKKQTLLLKSLLYYCKKNNTWDCIDYDCNVYFNFTKALSELNEFSIFYDGIPIMETIDHKLNNSQLQKRDSYNDELCKNILTEIIVDIKAKILSYWMIIPLNGSILDQNKKINSIRFIKGDEETKIKRLASLFNISLKDSRRRVKHIKTKGAPTFFKQNLLCLKIFSEESSIDQLAPHYSFLALSLLNVLYWSKIYDGHNYRKIFSKGLPLPLSKGTVIFTNRYDNYMYRNLNFNSEVVMNLNWIKQTKYMAIYSKYLNMLLYINKDNLTFRLFRALKFFHKSIETERNRDEFEGIGLGTTMLIIAAETLVLDKNQPKREKLSIVLPELCLPKFLNKSECTISIKTTYDWRCDLVHEGKDIWEHSSTNKTENKFHYYDLKATVANLIYKACQFLSNNENTPNRKDKWFNNIESIWLKAKLEKIHSSS